MEVVKNIIYKKINEIKPYVRNARDNEKTINLLVKIIPKVGFNIPIVIDEKGVIVKGHARYFAAIRLGYTEVPCVVSHASADNIKLDRIADNMVSEFSLWVTDSLLEELKDLDVDFDFEELSLPSFSDALDDDVAQVEAPVVSSDAAEVVKQTEEEAASGKIRRFYKIICPDCGQVSFVKVEEE